MKSWMIAIFSLLGICTGCQAQAEVKELTTEQYAEVMDTDTTAVILDVRRESEYAEGHLKGAMLLNFLDTEGFEQGLESLDKSKTYYLYCRSGRRSHNAAVKMQELGFKVYDMQGGILAWEKEGRPLEK